MRKNIKSRKKTKQAGGAKQPIIIQNVEVRPVNRTNQDIPKWRTAIQTAEARIPRRSLLYDLYADVVQDGHVTAVIGKRIDAVTTANWQFVNKEGEAVDEINELIDSIGFDEIVEEIVNTKFWGYSMLEPTFYKNESDRWEVSAGLIPRLNYRPHLGVVAYNYASDDGINIREGIYAKTVMEVGKTNDLGVLAGASQYAILKRGGVGDYAMYVQVFGRPIIDATWDGFDDAQKVKLQQALDIGAGGTIIRPDGTEVNILESKGTNTTIHPDFMKFLNKEISKALLGTTETVESSDSSGYAQAKEHGNQDTKKHDSDITYTRKVLNSRFIKILEAHGFNTQGGYFIVQGEETKLDPKESFEMVRSMVTELGLPVDDDYFYETYGIPKPKNYEQLKAEKEKEVVKDNLTTENSKKTEPKSKKTKSKEPTNTKEKVDEKEVKLFAKYFKPLLKLFQTAPAAMTGANGSHHTINLNLKATFNTDALIKRIYDAKGVTNFDLELFTYTVKSLLKGFKKGWDTEIVKLNYAPSFAYGIDDPALLTAFEQNLFRFAGVKTLAQAQLLNELFRKAKSFEEFYELAKAKVTIFNKDWLETEYSTALLTGEAAATYHRLIKQTDVFPYWKYTTAGDEHVRHSHKILNDIVLPANDKRWSKLFPPNGWNCRCYIVPRMAHEFNPSKLKADEAKADAYLASPAFAKEKAQGWGVNRGEIGQIFTANQQYIHKMPDMASKLLNSLGAADFGLLQYSNAKKIATAKAPTFKNTSETFFNELEVFENTPVIRDYNKRPLKVVKESIYKNDALLPAMQDTLLTPNEVWFNGNELETIVYIKYYKNKTFITTGTLKNGALNLQSWKVLKETKSEIETYRKGLLVHSK